MAKRLPKVTSRLEFTERERASWKRFTTIWADLSDALLLQPGACGPEWSVKDVINHTAVWQEAAVEQIGNLMAGRTARIGAGTDRFNAAQYALDRDRPLAESRVRLDRSRRKLLKLLRTVSDEQLLTVNGRQ
jgi:hypothetical protein